MPDKRPQLALLGGGIFVRSDYVPSLRELSELVSLHTVWSRSEESATDTASVVKDFAPNVLVKWGDAALSEIFQDEKIHAVAIVLSAQVQLGIVQRAILAGKHVIQEKPVGSRVSDVRDVFATYKALALDGGKLPIWAVAENFRFETTINEAAGWVKDIGDLLQILITAIEPMNKDNMYFKSVKGAWRKDFEGGMASDGGVHYIAGAKLLVGAGIKSLAAYARHTDSNLVPPDTISATLKFDNGCSGTIMMSWNGALKDELVWRILGTKGEVRVERVFEDGVKGFKGSLLPAGDKEPKTIFHPVDGVKEELRAFAANVAKVVFEGKEAVLEDSRGSVEEAIDDVAVIEAIFKSSASSKGFVQIEQLNFPSE